MEGTYERQRESQLLLLDLNFPNFLNFQNFLKFPEFPEIAEFPESGSRACELISLFCLAFSFPPVGGGRSRTVHLLVGPPGR